MHEAWSLAQAAMHGVGNDPPYNAKPAWLSMAHQQLDQAVAAAYGWLDYTPDMPDDMHGTVSACHSEQRQRAGCHLDPPGNPGKLGW